MQYIRVEGVDVPVSRIVFGTATPKLFAAFRSVHGGEPDFNARLNDAFALLDKMYEMGINCFDCANHYGEEPLGEWIRKRGLQEKAIVLTKGAHHSFWRKRVTPADILHDANNSLRRLGKRPEIYLLHRDNPRVSVGPIMDTLNRLRDEGKIGVFGASNWTVERFETANDYAIKHGLHPFTVASPNYSLAEQVRDPWGGGCTTLSGASGEKARRFYAENGISVFAYSPLARGLLSGRIESDRPEMAKKLLDRAGVKGYYSPRNIERLRRCEILAKEKNASVAKIAMAWLFNQREPRVFAISGSTREESMRDNIQACSFPLSEDECRWLDLQSDNRP